MKSTENPKLVWTEASSQQHFVSVLSNRFFFHILCPLSGRDSVSPGFPHKDSVIICAEYNAGTNHFVQEKMQTHLGHGTFFSSQLVAKQG